MNPSKDINHRSYNSMNRDRSDMTLYLIIILLTNMTIISYTNLIQYRAFKKGVR